MTTRPGLMPLSKIAAFPATASPSSLVFSAADKNRLIFLRWRYLVSRTQQRLIWNNLFSKPALGVTLLPVRTLAQVRPEPLSELWFTASFPAKRTWSNQHGILNTTAEQEGPQGNGPDHKSPDERTLKLGKTLRRLSPLLPNILATPLPQELLSPDVRLYLFPSTHPHLPVVKGRVPYRAALWTAPVAWGCIPVVGNVKLEIISEKIVRTGLVSAPQELQEDSHSDGLGEEKLVVRWRTEKKKNGSSVSRDSAASVSSLSSATDNGGVNRGLSTLLGGSQPIFKSSSNEPFTGLFVFSFDSKGRIASQTIEHADENQGFDKTSRVVTLTDWLLGKAKWGRAAREEEGLLGPVPGLAMKDNVCRQLIQQNHHDKRTGRWIRRDK